MDVRTEGQDCWTLSLKQLADKLGVSPRHIASLKSAGKLPAPIYLGKSVRWLKDDVQEWLKSGTPSGDKWKVAHKGGRR